MLERIKINTAVLICTAFIFRLLFVNISLVSSLSTNQNHSTIKRHFLTVIKKRRKQVEPVSASNNIGYSVVEILKEDSYEDELFKLNEFTLLFIFFFGIENKIKNILKKITPFNKHFTFSSSSRHIEYRVFRI